MPSRRRALIVLFLLALLVISSFAVALAAGSIAVTFHDLLTALFGGLWLISAALFHLAASSAARLT